MKRLVCSALVACFVMVSGVAVFADTHSTTVGGGDWEYGCDSQYVWSNYYHSSLGHKSSCTSSKSSDDSGWKNPRVTSYSKCSSSTIGVNHSYWDTQYGATLLQSSSQSSEPTSGEATMTLDGSEE